jgi:GlcNAc-P-P-Und epimerase
MMRMLVTGGSGFIGTNLVDSLLDKGIQFINLDIQRPKRAIHEPYWRECDILDLDRTQANFGKFKPTHVVHLAARTDVFSSNLDDYKVNTDGTNNVLNCIMAASTVERVIITSSQFVFGPPGDPKGDEDFKPVGAYGISKMISEKATRAAGLECIWTITRPTNIWGPWHPRYPNEFWLVLKKGLYFHPGGKSTIRSYGYVKNIIYQMHRILEAPPPQVDRKVYYLGEPSIPLLDWVNGFALAITGKPARVIPRPLLRTVAAMGSLLTTIGILFPITLSRYRSMTEDYFSPMASTIETFGMPPYTLNDGIKETVDWLKHYWNVSAS